MANTPKPIRKQMKTKALKRELKSALREYRALPLPPPEFEDTLFLSSRASNAATYLLIQEPADPRTLEKTAITAREALSEVLNDPTDALSRMANIIKASQHPR